MTIHVGTVIINSNSGTVNFGNVQNISPKSNSKPYSGSDGGTTGNSVHVFNGTSIPNTNSTGTFLDKNRTPKNDQKRKKRRKKKK